MGQTHPEKSLDKHLNKLKKYSRAVLRLATLFDKM